MAAALKNITRATFRQVFVCRRNFSSQIAHQRVPNIWKICGCALGGFASLYIVSKSRRSSSSIHLSVSAKEDNVPTKAERRAALVQTQREVRFLTFASIEFEGNIYMTPQDFLESVTEEIPRARSGRVRMDRREVEKILRKTQTRSRGSQHMFRDLNENGLISYTEYLFLLCVLTKSRSGFRIAFNMFDTDGNEKVDRQEFLVLESVLLGHVSPSMTASLVDAIDVLNPSVRKETEAMPPPAQSNIWSLLKNPISTTLESIITSHKTTSDHRLTSMLEDGSMGAPLADTTLTIHFFGNKGKDVLRYEDFHRFMDNLQCEVLELEFVEFSRGMATITEEEFARILLRYTILSQDDIEEYLTRLRQRIPQSKGITFKDFKEFGQFLNNLDDFALAMRIYTFADSSISESDFRRAVKAVTDQALDPHLVHVVFQLFDIDGDGKLSHKEFISVMKDRLHRGFRTALLEPSKWDEFKSCVKREIKHA